ncbi:UDP-2,3-diacylglucosamine pyrophosphatase [Niveispirillum lacus]|uniref:UDP-2,3-diacylglucosamine pyrophosphatase n=1 Tax=Niveispirillum lacus TaxID=1981099 RepID=A0A255YYJ2_9PROT|nr:UDP-2,3-diacylglucosamine diphosphatase LpxI [Niveispirillum lacus]OYQ33490.1 UDP-2,3-diacylglucosamine pyrophosphatase [Niveispirillum lacus]
MAGRLGIIAGGGDLPRQVAETCRRDGRGFFVIALEGQGAEVWLSPDMPHALFRMGAAGAILDRLRAEGVTDIILAGGVRRPSLTDLRPDWYAARFFARLGLKALGDDGLLRAVAALLEEEGFRVIAIQSMIADLLMPSGVLSQAVPDEAALADIAHGLTVAHALGAVDVGQAVVVQAGLVLGVEAIEGTDALISRCGALRRDGTGPILVKCAKPGQDRRLDLPTIGPDTVAACIAAGFAGIAAEAGATLFVGRQDALQAADAAGLFVMGVSA